MRALGNKVFGPPTFERDEDNFRARFINGFAWVVIVALSLVVFADGRIVFSVTDVTDAVLTVLIVIHLLALGLLRRKQLNWSGLLIITVGWVGLTFQAYSKDGVRDVVVIAYIAVALLASFVVSGRAGVLVILASILMIQVLTYLEVKNLITPRFQDPENFSRDLTLLFAVIAALVYISTTSLRDAIARAQKSEASLQQSNIELQNLNLNLENRVISRTTELEQANQRNVRRARQLEAIAQVARAISSTRDIDTLLAQIPEVLNREFGFYHVGIFLLDTAREYAVLSGTNSDGGRRMLARGHRLKVGETGMVGFTTNTGRPRVALDTGADAVFFNNPDLPETRSALTLPLMAGSEVIGALDVQSTEANAFDQEDIRNLGTLADQVSIAIQNARQYEETRRALAESEALSRQFVESGWSRFTRRERLEGIRHTGARATLLYGKKGTDGETSSSEQEQFKPKGRGAVLALPVRLRGEVIGSVNVRSPENRQWDQDELDIVNAIIERSAIAMENARLLTESQKLAAKERAIGEISARISTQSEIDDLLKTAAQELSRSLPGMQVAVQLLNDEERE